MRKCSICKQLEIQKAGIQAYRALAQYHYRDNSIGPYAAIYKLAPKARLAKILQNTPIGVIVYRMPVIANRYRTIALAPILKNLAASDKLAFLNRNVRTISRVIIDPRFRSLGLAAMLVKNTMPLLNVTVIESLAVMGRANPFFKKAGMTEYQLPASSQVQVMKNALQIVGITDEDLFDEQLTHQKLQMLDKIQHSFIETQIQNFLKHYGKKRLMQNNIDRTSFILGALGDTPLYYLWINNANPSTQKNGESL